MKLFLTLNFLLWMFPFDSRAQPAVSKFRAAVVKVDITPQDSQNLLGYGARKSTGVLDAIFHRIVVMDDGTTQFVLVSSDICLFSPAEYDRVAARVKSLYGINPLNFWWTVTHTHSAPEVGQPGLGSVFMGDRYKHEVDPGYTPMIEQKLLDAIGEARKKLIPAKLGVTWGFSQANINRRAVDVDGKASLGLNPDGPVDRRIGLIRIDKSDGSPLVLLANYAIHGTVLGGASTQISGDAPGVVAQYVEEKTGAPLLFLNGAAGNLAPIYSVYPTAREGHLSQFRVLLGDKILEANKKLISDTNDVTLKSGSLVVKTPRKAGLGWPVDMNNYTTTTKAGINMILLPVRFLQLNDNITLWSAPLELFCEISNDIRERSPFPYTFYVGYGNGWLGYLPTASAWDHGGYEVEVVCPYTPAAAKDLTEGVLGFLQEK
ncbi:MAG: neutral/alkaline non-lysosomal ceramidase N-terminal domain-containing protein [Cyclobacteriaceae bacterium]